MEFSPRDKPKFCSKCGAQLGQDKGSDASSLSDESAIEEDEATRVPDIGGLDFELDASFTPRPETLGSLVGTLDSSAGGLPPSPNQPKTTKEQAMEQFKKEAGSLRRSPAQKDDSK